MFFLTLLHDTLSVIHAEVLVHLLCSKYSKIREYMFYQDGRLEDAVKQLGFYRGVSVLLLYIGFPVIKGYLIIH